MSHSKQSALERATPMIATAESLSRDRNGACPCCLQNQTQCADCLSPIVKSGFTTAVTRCAQRFKAVCGVRANRWPSFPSPWTSNASTQVHRERQTAQMVLARAFCVSLPSGCPCCILIFLRHLHSPKGTRLLITGGMMEVYRQIFTWLARSVVDRFCITATFHDKDPIYSTSLLELAGRSLMMIRLAAVLAFALTYMAYVIKRYWESWVIHITTTGEARDIEVTTRHYGLETDRSMHPWLSTKDDPRDTGKAMSYLPREGKTYHMWYRRRLLLVSRREKTGVSSFQPQEMLRIRYVGPADMKFRRVSLTLGPGFSPLTTGFSVHFSMKLERSSKRPGTMSYQYGLLIRMS